MSPADASWLDTAVRLTRDIGGDYLGGVMFSKLGKYAAPVTERGRANSVDSIAWVADRAAEAGVTLGLEFCNRYETNVLNTTEQTLEFIEDVDRPNVMAHLDVYHMNIEEVSFAGAVHAAAAAGRFGYVHLGESHRGALGTGSVPFPEFFAALHDVDYQGIAHLRVVLLRGRPPHAVLEPRNLAQHVDRLDAAGQGRAGLHPRELRLLTVGEPDRATARRIPPLVALSAVKPLDVHCDHHPRRDRPRARALHR